MNLRQRLDEIRQLAEKATPGEWRFKQYDRIRYSLMGGHRYVMGQDVVSSPALPDDAALIAAMRNAIGPLMEVVEQQHRALAQVLDSWECENMLFDSDTDVTRAALSLTDKEEA